MTPLDYEFLRKLLKERSGLDLSADKQYLVESRLIPLARKAGLPGLPELVQKLKGSADAPEISVHPLSVLTPGLLKDLFHGLSGGGKAPKPVVEDGRSEK